MFETESWAERLQSQIDELARRLEKGDAERHSLTVRADAAQVQADHDRDMIVDLQAQGVVSEQRSRDLETALRSSRTIGKAVGILMESRKLSEDAAFAVHNQASQDSNRKLREIAAEIVARSGPAT
jgi:hypothetical protein